MSYLPFSWENTKPSGSSNLIIQAPCLFWMTYAITKVSANGIMSSNRKTGIYLALFNLIDSISRVGQNAHKCNRVTSPTNGSKDFKNNGSALQIVAGSSISIVTWGVQGHCGWGFVSQTLWSKSNSVFLSSPPNSTFPGANIPIWLIYTGMGENSPAIFL